MAIHSYLSEATLRIHLPGDDKDPTIFHVRPVTMQAHTEWRAEQEYAAKQLAPFKTPDSMISAKESARRQAEEDLSTLSTFIVKAENAWMDGKMEALIVGDKLKNYLRGMLVVQRGQLLNIIMDDMRLQELSFRDQPDTPISGKAAEVEAGREEEG